jgi:LPPG:FO 2-phospho-L-lactate transferase
VKVVVLTGGLGGAKFLLGARAALAGREHEITAVVNTGDDLWIHGLQVCPDLDTCMYTLGGGLDLDRGWGRTAETWSIKDELAAYGTDSTWFGLGDRDIATHLVRSRMLRAGYPLSAVTEALCKRWNPGVRLLPMSDDRVETHVAVDDPESVDEPGTRTAIHFQEWWVRYGAELPAHAIVPVGAEQAKPGPGVLEAIAAADVILVAPSNPVVSIGTILSVPGIADAIRTARANVVGVSPIIAGKAVRGMAEACLNAINVATTAEAVGRHYGPRKDGGLLDGWLIHTGDTATIPGVTVREVPLLMTGEPATTALANAALDLAGTPR